VAYNQQNNTSQKLYNETKRKKRKKRELADRKIKERERNNRNPEICQDEVPQLFEDADTVLPKLGEHSWVNNVIIANAVCALSRILAPKFFQELANITKSH